MANPEQNPTMASPEQNPNLTDSGQYFATALPPQHVVYYAGPTPMMIQPDLGPPPPTYLPLAILSLCFFWPIGIVAIIYSVKAKSYIESANYGAAREASKVAKFFIIIAFVIAFIDLIVMIVFIVLIEQGEIKTQKKNITIIAYKWS